MHINRILPDKVTILIAASILASLLLSALLLAQDNVVNNDGVTYLVAAERIKAGEWGKALQIYNWLFYPWLIAIVSKATSLSLEWSAYTINSLLLCITISAFILLSREVEKRFIFLVISAIVILVYPTLNDYRTFVIRDHGYIAFYLLAIYFFIQYIHNKCWKNSILWALMMLLATAFRVEGIVFLVCMPAVLLIEKELEHKERLWNYIKANIPLVVIGLVSVVILFTTELGQYMKSSKLEVTVRTMSEVFSTQGEMIVHKIAMLEKYVLSKYEKDHSTIIFYIILATILIAGIIKTLTPINTLLAAISLYIKRDREKDVLLYLWYWLIVLNVLVLAVFVLRHHFITGRFPLAMAVTILLIVSFSIVAAYKYFLEKGSAIKNRIILGFLAVVALIFVLDGIVITGTSKRYIKEGGQWFAENIDPNTRYYSNNVIFSYYANQASKGTSHFEFNTRAMNTILTSGKWKNYDYLVISMPRKKAAMLNKHINKRLSSMQIKQFSNKRGDAIKIFRVRH